jgi:hypothetical protein
VTRYRRSRVKERVTLTLTAVLLVVYFIGMHLFCVWLCARELQ